MKLTLKPLLAAIALGAVAAGPVHAGAFAAADLNISDIFLAVNVGGSYVKVGPSMATITLTGESRTGTAAANYNGVSSIGPGPGSITGTNGEVNVLARCVGPDCGPTVDALYGGVTDNNLTTHLSPPPMANFALGDMLIRGSALAGTITGLTRADAAATGPTNNGGSNATILNSATVQATFSVGTTVTAAVGATGDSWIYAWVSALVPGLTNFAGAGESFTVNVRCSVGCGAGWSNLSFTPDEFNAGGTSSIAADNTNQSFTGSVYSAERTYLAGTRYALTINQASNATVSSAPEPASLALAGMALLGLGVATRRRLGKKTA